ncbi:hypothetical protein KR026_012081 [Drosophila bipectinata]|nr:hypothetical protein KR026_012081 [Drosophila bipectinata]
MPNFNGAIIVHTLQLINSPATLREIVVTIAKHTQLPQDELKMPVKQTVEMGHRLGFLQKLNGRYYLAPMTFQTLNKEVQALTLEEEVKKPKPSKAEKKAKATVVENKPSKKSVKKLEESKSQVSETERPTAVSPRFKNVVRGIPPLGLSPAMTPRSMRFQ